MKFLLVLALALVAVSAEEEKKEFKALPYAYGFNPIAYNTYGYNYPTFYNNLAYNTAPYAAYPYAYPQVQIKPVEKEVEVLVKKIEYVVPENSCFNSMGGLVPCRTARSADEEEMKPEEDKKIVPFTYGYPLAYSGYPTMYNQFYNQYNQYPLTYSNQYPLAYNNYATYGYPAVTYTTPYGCTNFKGEQVACRVTRSADEEEMKPEEKKVTPFTYGYPLAYSGYPTMYNQFYNQYNQYPLTYSNQYHLAYNNYATYGYPAVTYTAPKPIVQEVEYLKPVLKEVVQKVPFVPTCMNSFGLAVPCADIE